MGVLDKAWRVVDVGDTKYYEPASPSNIPFVEDMSIFTTDNEEVVGCSEWMRADRETFDHIVKIHNDQLEGEA
jgi:hypothetical protein